MTDDLVKRLRNWTGDGWIGNDYAISDQAADRIEELERQLHEVNKNEISPYEWMAREFDRLAILRKMWSAHEVAATLRRYDTSRDKLEKEK